jgi:hypothetical protein
MIDLDADTHRITTLDITQTIRDRHTDNRIPRADVTHRMTFYAFIDIEIMNFFQAALMASTLHISTHKPQPLHRSGEIWYSNKSGQTEAWQVFAVNVRLIFSP